MKMSADKGYDKTDYRLTYFTKTQLMSNRVHNELMLYPQYVPEPQKHDATKAFIPDDLEESVDRLSRPSKKYVKEALIRINKALRTIEGDCYYHKDENKLKRVSEWMRFRDHICCLFLKHPESPSAPEYYIRYIINLNQHLKQS
jgi:hypothetical protein